MPAGIHYRCSHAQAHTVSAHAAQTPAIYKRVRWKKTEIDAILYIIQHKKYMNADVLYIQYSHSRTYCVSHKKPNYVYRILLDEQSEQLFKFEAYIHLA